MGGGGIEGLATMFWAEGAVFCELVYEEEPSIARLGSSVYRKMVNIAVALSIPIMIVLH